MMKHPNPEQRSGLFARMLTPRTISLAFLFGAAAILAMPPRTGHLRTRGRPSTSYAEACERFAALAALDGPEVNAQCGSRLLDHGAPTESVVVLLHGMTSCPVQFNVFGEQLHQRGHTVLIPRLPRNGMADRRTAELGRLQPAELVAFGDEVVDIACGLGKRVIVLGLSAGGTVAAWIAQERSEVARTMMIAPFLGISTLPLLRQAVIRNTLLRIPNIMVDDKSEEAARKPEYNYIRKALRSFGVMMLVGEYVLRESRRRPPASGEVVMVTNDADTVVNRQLIDQLTQRWQTHDHQRIIPFSFSTDDNLAHDMIDPRQPTARIDYVYPLLIQYLEA